MPAARAARLPRVHRRRGCAHRRRGRAPLVAEAQAVSRFWSFDTETHLIAPGVLAPRMVCLSAAERAGDTIATELVLRPTGMMILRQRLESDSIIVGANL